MKIKLAVMLLILVTLCYFTNQFISGSADKSHGPKQPVKIVMKGSTIGTYYQKDAPKSEKSRVESEAMDTVVRLADLPLEERSVQYQAIVHRDTAYSYLVKYIYENGHLPERSGLASFLDVPRKYAFFSGITPRDAFEQAHLQSALKYYREPLACMRDQSGMDRLTPFSPGL